MAPLGKQYGHDSTGVQAPRDDGGTRIQACCGAFRRIGPPSWSECDPLAAVGTEQVQLVTRRNRPDPVADRGSGGSGNPDDDLARGEFAWIGGDAGAVLLPGPVNERLGPDVLDGLNREVQGDAARDVPVRDHEILRPDAENAV